jgi:hypothetical protein
VASGSVHELWVELRNVVCELAGESPQQILVVAHHDQSPDTIQGADNDGSGIAILLQLAKIFASEPTPRYSLVFVSTDAEEYGMIGCKRYVDTHPDTRQIIAGISLDNLGKEFYNGVELSPIGQFRNYGPIWLLLGAREAARAGGDLWVPKLCGPFDQVLNQAVPVSFMDQGPMVAAGIPALGFAGLYDSPTTRRKTPWPTSPLTRFTNPGALPRRCCANCWRWMKSPRSQVRTCILMKAARCCAARRYGRSLLRL